MGSLPVGAVFRTDRRIAILACCARQATGGPPVPQIQATPKSTYRLPSLTPFPSSRDDRCMPQPPSQELLSVQQAIRIIDQAPVAPRTARVPLEAAVGLRLADDLTADRDYPPFLKSLMDGYAVRRVDVGALPAELRVVGEVAAGASSHRALEAGEAMAIMTGAPLPTGADGVVPVEDVEQRVPIGEIVRILRAPASPRYTAAPASDCPAGRVVLKAGTMLGPRQIAVAAAIGADEVLCFARPRVAVLGTGDEIVPVYQTPGPWQIRDSNTPMLAALLRNLGCEVADVGTVRDDPEETRAALRHGLSFDALFVTGGMSMGEYDYVPRLLAELGVELKITKLRIKPGKPFVFGSLSPTSSNEQQSSRAPRTTPTYVFGLPGNPVSAFVCTVRLASRLAARMGGGLPIERWVTGRLTEGLPANGPREFYQPAIRAVAPGHHSGQSEFASITPLAWTGSADLFTLASANVLLVRAEDDSLAPKGTLVRVLEI